MQHYTCFFHPESEVEHKSLDSICAVCGKEMAFPLKNIPKKIGNFKIVKALSRGFYGATYVVEKPIIKRYSVLKVVPKKTYSHFGKDFHKECQIHSEIAQDSEHLVGIQNVFDEEVSFGDEILECHISELDYVDGVMLSDYKNDNTLSGSSIAQIALDLYSIIEELTNRSVYHNDLHAGNLMVQSIQKQRRINAIDDNLKLIAIDLGSVEQESKSSYQPNRSGDLRWAVRHIRDLTAPFFRNPDRTNDLDFRIATILEEHCASLDHPIENLRLPRFEELKDEIRREMNTKVISPWTNELQLASFDGGYNAQTLKSWHVPSLLEDPDGRWLNRLSSPGPTIITGMRGCGKTMLLRSLTFHARSSKQGIGEDREKAIHRVATDQYFGVFVSSNRIGSLHENEFEQLFLSFLRESLQTLRHVYEFAKENPSIGPCPESRVLFSELKTVAIDCLENFDKNVHPTWGALDRALQKAQITVGESTGVSLRISPQVGFEMLAEGLKKATSFLGEKYILFLLDDVSTRFLSEQCLTRLVSELLFKSDNCAFKFTTEAQTFELLLKNPGEGDLAWEGRDYSTFDLGREVNSYFDRSLKEGENFILSILEKRSRYYSRHPERHPKQIVGDKSLMEIAKEIASSSSNAKEKKGVYSGISALRGVCVGDIGDCIRIYEEILQKGDGVNWPVSEKVQSECFQDFCHQKLFFLSKRAVDLKAFAIGFAQASNDLLRKSSNTSRLRQYTKLYVSLTRGDTARQISTLRKLIDAGVFVFDGGSISPRTKTRDSDPLSQFVLSYRKVLGLSSFMPISDRDRYELSGERLEEFLFNPKNCKQILVDSQAKGSKTRQQKDTPHPKTITGASTPRKVDTQMPLFDISPQNIDSSAKLLQRSENESILKRLRPEISIIDSREIPPSVNEYICGIGFEERTVESLRRVGKNAAFEKIILVEYPEQGNRTEILSIAKSLAKNISIIPSSEFANLTFSGPLAVDITGLSKPFLFNAIRHSLLRFGEVAIIHTHALENYPREKDLQRVAGSNVEIGNLFEITQEVISGEKGPYRLLNLIEEAADDNALRSLCCASSPKHDRLFSLVEQRDFDWIEILVRQGTSIRDQISYISADTIRKNWENVYLFGADSHSLFENLKWAIECYQKSAFENGMSFEVGLTGNKCHAAALSIASTFLRVSAAWYVSPSQYDVDRFSEGVGKTMIYHITGGAK